MNKVLLPIVDLELNTGNLARLLNRFFLHDELLLQAERLNKGKTQRSQDSIAYHLLKQHHTFGV